MKNPSRRVMGLIAINIAAVMFGSSALFGKLAASPFWIVAARAAFAALALLPVGLIRGDITMPPRRHWPALGLTGFILAVHWLTFFAAVQLGGVAVATLTFAALPLFTILIESLHSRRLPHGMAMLASVAIIAAVALLVDPHGGDFWGVAVGLASAVTFSWFSHASKQLNQSLPPLPISLYQNAAVAIILAPCLFFVTPAPAMLMDWVWLAALGIVITAMMHQLYFYALRRLSAAVCNGFVVLEPVYAIIFASVIFGEPVTMRVVFSAFLIIGSSLILLKYEDRETQAA